MHGMVVVHVRIHPVSFVAVLGVQCGTWRIQDIEVHLLKRNLTNLGVSGSVLARDARSGTLWSRSGHQNLVELVVVLAIPKTLLLEEVSILVFAGHGTWRKESTKTSLTSVIVRSWQRQEGNKANQAGRGWRYRGNWP